MAQYRSEDYTVGWISVIEVELVAARSALDSIHPSLPSIDGDDNHYIYGSIGPHNVVVATLPSGTIGTNAATRVALRMNRTFTHLRIRLLVGIGGGVPSDEADVRLGDVIVSDPNQQSPGVIQYDLGKTQSNERWPLRISVLNKPPEIVRTAVAGLRARYRLERDSLANRIREIFDRYPTLLPEYSHPGSDCDRLFTADYPHERYSRSCKDCDQARTVARPSRQDTVPLVHYGTIASGNQVVKDSITRDYWRDHEKVLCFEMEAAGIIDEFPCLVVRGAADYADSHKNDIWQPYSALAAASYAKDLLLEIPPHKSITRERSIDLTSRELSLGFLSNQNAQRQIEPERINYAEATSRDREEWRQAIISALHFPRSEVREEEIEEAYSQTFEWLLYGTYEETGDERGSGFVEWLQDPNAVGIYWISGKAGSGKSTLMKKLGNEKRLDQHIQKWSQGEKVIRASFYFHDRGSSPLQKSRIGLLRSLLYQVLRTSPKLADKAFYEYLLRSAFELRNEFSANREWSYGTLIQGFRRISEVFSANSYLYIHVDGLDEYTGSELETLQQSDNITEALRTEKKSRGHTEIAELFRDIAKYPGIKVCVSSRPLQRFYDLFHEFPNLKLEHLTKSDIKTYVDGRFAESLSFVNLHSQCHIEMQQLAAEVVHMASGVFLWVRLVVNLLTEGLHDRDSIKEMQSKLKSIPIELGGPNGLFARMLKDVKPHHIASSVNIFRLVLAARRPPFTLLLDFSEDPDPQRVVSEPIQLMRKQDFETKSRCMEDRLRSRSNGLLESKASARIQCVRNWLPMRLSIVQFIHQTVKEWFQETSTWSFLEERLVSVRQDTTFHPNFALLCGSLRSLKTLGFVADPGSFQSWLTWERINDALFYAIRIERCTTSAAYVELLVDELDLVASKLFRGKLYREPCYDYDDDFDTEDEDEREYITDEDEIEEITSVDGYKIPVSSWCMMEEHREIDLYTQNNFLSLCIQVGLEHYVKSKINKGGEAAIRKAGRPLLHVALDRGYGTLLPFLSDNQSLQTLEGPPLGVYYRTDRGLAAPFQSDPSLVECLLEHGADPNATFYKANIEGYLRECVTGWSLAAAGYQPTSPYDGPEDMCKNVDDTCRRWLANLKLMIRFGAIVEEEDRSPSSLYFIARSLCNLRPEREEMVALLIAKGCKLLPPEVKDLKKEWCIPSEEVDSYPVKENEPNDPPIPTSVPEPEPFVEEHEVTRSRPRKRPRYSLGSGSSKT